MRERFSNRSEAGRFLAKKLMTYANREDVLVLALPPGGVPVAYEIAWALNAPLDVFLVRKLRVLLHEKLAMGATASGGVRVLDLEVIRHVGVTASMIEAATREERVELERRERVYRGNRPPLEIAGHDIVLVDDGMAMGGSIKVAVLALRQERAAKVIVAVPVGPAELCVQSEMEADEVVCGRASKHFGAVGEWYEDFPQITDDEVCALLAQRAHERRSASAIGGPMGTRKSLPRTAKDSAPPT